MTSAKSIGHAKEKPPGQPNANNARASSKSLASVRSGSQRHKFDSIGRKYHWSARSSLASVQDNGDDLPPEAEQGAQIKTSSMRFVVLLLFCLNSGNKSFQWIEIVALATKATEYYQVSNYVINVTSIVFLLSFIVLSWPACLLIESIGLRKAVLLASIGTATGSVVKCLSCESNEATSLGITLLLIGQVIVSLAEQLIFSVPSRLASVWFPDHEVSRAVALSWFGNQLGVALGFLLPNYLLRDAVTRYQMGQAFYQLYFWTAVYSIIVLVACFLLFDEEPQFAPGKARWRQRELERATDRTHDESIWTLVGTLFKHMGALMKNVHLVLLALSYGLIVGANNMILTLLEQMFATVWPSNDVVVGYSGFLFVTFGAVGMIFLGWIMDTTHAYKCINIWLAIGSIVSTIIFAYLLECWPSIPAIYAVSTLMGICTTGPLATGLEYAVEMTYPAPELVTSSVMNVMPQIAATPAILIGSYLVDTFGQLQCNMFVLGQFIVGLLLLIMTREKLARQEEIENQSKQAS